MTHVAWHPVTFFIAAYLLTVFLVPLVVSAVVSCRALPTGRECPRCRHGTFLLQSRALRWASRLPHLRIERRWCPSCTWEGAVRVREPSVRLVLRDRAPAATASRIRDIRSLVVDGIAWRVQLESWRLADVWYGRLVFVEPGGRHWLDARPLMGMSYQDVQQQARSIPSGLLVLRLRELVSD
jgi:hypothetical protein